MDSAPARKHDGTLGRGWLSRLAALLLAAPAVVAAGSAGDTPIPTGRPGADFTRDALEFERLAGELVAQSGIPGLALTMVQGDRVLVARGYGVVDSRGSEPVTAHTVFRLASLSKGFAGTLAGLLTREGALRWDAPAVNYLPALHLADPHAVAHLSVRDILSHRIGIQPYNFLDRALEADEPYPLLAARLDQAPMRCSPGDCYAYQNIAFSLIGDISFAVTGEFYTLSVEKRLLHPLGMHDATFGRAALESSPSWARPHVRAGHGWRSVPPKDNYYRVPPAAGLNASAADMGQWLIAQLGHRPDVLPPGLLAEVHAPQIATPDQLGGSPWRRARLRAAHYGLGWRIYDYAGHRMIYHAGAVQGYRAIIALLPERDIGLALLWHSEHRAPSALLPAIADRALGLNETDWLQLDPPVLESAQR